MKSNICIGDLLNTVFICCWGRSWCLWKPHHAQQCRRSWEHGCAGPLPHHFWMNCTARRGLLPLQHLSETFGTTLVRVWSTLQWAFLSSSKNVHPLSLCFCTAHTGWQILTWIDNNPGFNGNGKLQLERNERQFSLDLEITHASVSLLWFLLPSQPYQRCPAEALTESSKFHVLLLIKAMLSSSSLACFPLFFINYLLLLGWGIIVSQMELAFNAGFANIGYFSIS